MPAFDEELFGPVAAVVAATDEGDAIRLANQTVFGLGAAVFTRDLARGERIARHELEAGSCFVNAFVRSDPRLPFGGIKESGYGRELARVRHPRVREREDGVRGVTDAPVFPAGSRSSTATASTCGVCGNMSTGWTRTTR